MANLRTEHLSDEVFPSDIMKNILSRLPVKPLVRFRCVSKEWCTLLKDSHFINMHLTCSKGKKNEFNLIFGYLGSTQICSSMTEFTTLHNVSIDPMASWNEYVNSSTGPFSADCEFSEYEPIRSSYLVKTFHCQVNLLGSCNGIICVTRDFQTVILWNPSTRQSRQVPSIPDDLKPVAPTVRPIDVYGFGYHAASVDYKVVKIQSCVIQPSYGHSTVSVYSLATNSWKRIQNIVYSVFDGRMGELINGCLYWIAVHSITHNDCVISFDFDNENFHEHSLPEYEKEDLCDMNVAELYGKVCIVCTYTVSCEVWIRQEDGERKSWNKVLTIKDMDGMSWLEPVFSTNSGVTVGFLKNLTEIFLCQPRNNRSRTLLRTNCGQFAFRAKMYVESLVDLNVDNGMEGR